ncbi:sperm acrosome membrane-associated protein 4-like [Terrapene carolina triunguis]|uniref:Sperm acrosome membrane-associated protein 4-like n=1 Tax=Terrapene triunguis TaxID=2587831 RepID=A0A674K133_9SAUR|nr:sperm acrosome membrane-associated protein 4-like [Terrapene carolina triunguis]XP_026518900.1 sperm acrosome membrane-associated protein 4-like [Terrapene carolina triunguis]
MDKTLLLCLAILTCAGIGAALQCLKCDFTVFGIPCHTTTVTCKDDQLCATIRGRAAGQRLMMKKNCVDKVKCNANDTSTWMDITYSTSYECCEGEFCNSGTGAGAQLSLATGAQLSLAAGLAMLGVWLTRGL